MRVARGDEGLVEDVLRLLESCLEIAVAPLLRRLARWQLAVAGLREVRRGPFEGLKLYRYLADVAAVACVRAAGKRLCSGSP
jgi:hypothetical protein